MQAMHVLNGNTYYMYTDTSRGHLFSAQMREDWVNSVTGGGASAWLSPTGWSPTASSTLSGR